MYWENILISIKYLLKIKYVLWNYFTNGFSALKHEWHLLSLQFNDWLILIEIVGILCSKNLFYISEEIGINLKSSNY